MKLAERVLEVARLLTSERDADAAARLLLEKLLALTGTERGFVVVHEGDTWVEKFDVGFDRRAVSTADCRFSRALVRRAVESRESVYSPSASEDARFEAIDSVAELGRRAVLAVPLCDGEEVRGVVYFDGPSPIDAETRRLAAELAGLAAPLLGRALEEDALRRRAASLENDLLRQFDFAGIVTHDPRMLAVLRTISQVADAEAPVLIRGETGTGKELMARALHVNSSRRSRPFVAIHCAALQPTLLETELFGHVRGAFTGADRERPGRIATARGGTLLIDEVGEIPLEAQVKLLRFLESGEIQRVGSDRTEHVEVRVVCATNRDLKEMVREGKFRQDLYYRIQVLELVLPPLRERAGDRELLVEHFLARFGKGRRLRLHSDARAALARYDYPGNARELEHAVERMVLLATSDELGVELLPDAIRAHAGSAAPVFSEYTGAELRAARAAAVEGVEQQFIAGLLQKSEGNVSAAARHAGLPRGYLQKVIARRRKR